MRKTKVIIGTHGKFGEELINSAKLILGETDLFEAVSLTSNMSLEDYKDTAEELIINTDGQILVLVDLLGGTPSNVFALLSKQYNFPIVTGVNLPLLLDLFFKVNGDSVDLNDIGMELPNVVSESSIYIASKY